MNLCSTADNSTQLVPFLKEAESMGGIREYQPIQMILHFEPQKGHNGIDMDEAIHFLYNVVGQE